MQLTIEYTHPLFFKWNGSYTVWVHEELANISIWLFAYMIMYMVYFALGFNDEINLTGEIM